VAEVSIDSEPTSEPRPASVAIETRYVAAPATGFHEKTRGVG
jgi:hypothetical protein